MRRSNTYQNILITSSGAVLRRFIATKKLKLHMQEKPIEMKYAIFLETEEESTHFIFHFIQDKMHLQRHVSKTRSVISSLLLTLVIIVRYWFTSLQQHGIHEQEDYPYTIYHFLRIRFQLQSYIVTRWPLFYMPVNLKMSFLL